MGHTNKITYRDKIKGRHLLESSNEKAVIEGLVDAVAFVKFLLANKPPISLYDFFYFTFNSNARKTLNYVRKPRVVSPYIIDRKITVMIAQEIRQKLN